MYSFHPIADTSMNHYGFYVYLIVALAVLVVILLDIVNDSLSSEHAIAAVFLVLVGWLVHTISFNDKPPVNIPISATYVGFQPEGYNEQSGKMRADKHYMYVVYEVDGRHVILQASEGLTYPKQVTLYKN